VVVVRSPVPMPDIAAVTDHTGGFAFVAPEPGEYEFAAHSSGVSGVHATGVVVVPATPGAGTAATRSRDSDVAVGRSSRGAERDTPPLDDVPEVEVTIVFPG
jgi:hypothetical protein